MDYDEADPILHEPLHIASEAGEGFGYLKHGTITKALRGVEEGYKHFAKKRGVIMEGYQFRQQIHAEAEERKYAKNNKH